MYIHTSYVKDQMLCNINNIMAHLIKIDAFNNN